MIQNVCKTKEKNMPGKIYQTGFLSLVEKETFLWNHS